MARIRFLTDEHIPNAVANGLRARGIDASSIGLLIGGAMLIAEVLTSKEMMNHVEFL